MLTIQLAALFVVGLFLGSLVNWAIYTLAWNPRSISPWSPPHAEAPPRQWVDRLPVVGWLALRREAALHGPRYWVRPLLVEVGVGTALAALYWWEVVRLGLIQEQVGAAITTPAWSVHWQFVSHAVLLCWMLAATFIDIDEKIIPDEITVTGTLLGLMLATLVPLSLLPIVAERAVAPVVGEVLVDHAGQPLLGMAGQPLWVEAVTPVAPVAWGPPAWAQPLTFTSLVVALGCYWFWCFALAPRIWRGRRGRLFALRLIAARVRRELGRPPLRWILLVGSAAIVSVWVAGGPAWVGLMTALVGLVGGGGIVWAVRLIGTAALRREAMGFGDVTLMMMVGTFIGWQASLIAFFLAPFAGLLVGIAQFVFRRDDVIPYGPFLCLAAAVTVVCWAPIWNWAAPLFAIGGLVPLVLVVCLVLLGVFLAIWQMFKTLLFGRA